MYCGVNPTVQSRINLLNRIFTIRRWMTLLCTNTKFIKETVNPLPSYYNKNKYNKSTSLIVYLTASDAKNCTTVNKERNSSKLTTQVILVLYQYKERELTEKSAPVVFSLTNWNLFISSIFFSCKIIDPKIFFISRIDKRYFYYFINAHNNIYEHYRPMEYKCTK